MNINLKSRAKFNIIINKEIPLEEGNRIGPTRRNLYNPLQRFTLKEAWILEIVFLLSMKSRWQMKWKTILFNIYFYVSLMNSYLLIFIDSMSTNPSIYDFVRNILTQVLWFVLQTKQKEFRNLVCYFTNCTNKVLPPELLKKDRYKMKAILMFGSFSPVLFGISISISLYFTEEHSYVPYWTYGTDFSEQKSLEIFLASLSITVYYCTFLVPSIATAQLCTLNIVLSGRIDAMRQRVNSSNIVNQLQYYQVVLRLHNMIENFFSLPMMYIMLIYAMGTLSSLSLSLGQGGASSIMVIQESVACAVLCGFAIFFIINTSSNVTLSASRWKQKFQFLQSSVILNLDTQSQKYMEHLKFLSNIEPFYLTVNSMFRIDNSLLASSIGCFLTYGVLIVKFS